MYKCEGRLRTLHPHAMARYDRLRSDGLTPVAAMRLTAPLFSRPPNVHEGAWAPRPSLAAGNGRGYSWAAAEHGPSRAEWEAHVTTEAQTRRAREIIQASQDQAQADGRGPLGETEQRLQLETATNLPPGIILAAVQPDTAAASASRRPMQPWAQDFPIPIDQVLTMVATPQSSGQSVQAPARRPLRQAPRPGRST
jgi:hypothetical protein